MVRRREFMVGLGSAAAWPLATSALSAERVRRLGVLLWAGADDPIVQAEVAALREGLAKLGWTEGRNLRIELRVGSTADRYHSAAEELVSGNPDVIVTIGGPETRAAQRQTKTIPIVFMNVGDPTVTGIVKNVARPEGNATGVTNLYSTLSGKWLQLLKEAVPRIERVGVIYDAQLVSGVGTDSPSQLPSVEAAAHELAVQLVKLPYRGAIDIVRGIDSFAAEPNGGLIEVPPAPSAADRRTMVEPAIQHRLPTIFWDRQVVVEGGLMAYSANTIEIARRAAFYVDRILRGAKVSDLPVEYPTKFEFGDQPQDCQSDGPHHFRVVPSARRRDHRVGVARRKLVRSSRWKSCPNRAHFQGLYVGNYTSVCPDAHLESGQGRFEKENHVRDDEGFSRLRKHAGNRWWP